MAKAVEDDGAAAGGREEEEETAKKGEKEERAGGGGGGGVRFPPMPPRNPHPPGSFFEAFLPWGKRRRISGNLKWKMGQRTRRVKDGYPYIPTT